MRFILLAVFIAGFVVMPMYLLNNKVLPALNTLRQEYAQGAAIAAGLEQPRPDTQ